MQAPPGISWRRGSSQQQTRCRCGETGLGQRVSLGFCTFQPRSSRPVTLSSFARKIRVGRVEDTARGGCRGALLVVKALNSDVASAENWWGKERTWKWEQEVLRASSAGLPHPCEGSCLRQNLGAVLAVPGCHPVAHIYWRNPPGCQNSRPSVARVNSAAASLELPVQWSRVLQLADRRQASQVSSPSGQPVWRVYAVQGGEGALPTVADTASLEVCLAAALLGHNVEVSIVEGFRESDMSVLQGKTHWALEEGWTLLRRSPSQLWLDFQPHVVGSRRDTELACWPKVWQFAQQLRKGSGSRAAESLGAMDATWCHKRSRWLISNRHRALAALLLSTPLECIVSLPQKTGDNKAFWPGPASKTRLKRVSRAAEALNSLACSGKPASVSAEALHRAIGLCEEALQKAPKESSEAGVTWEAVGVLRALEARTERETSRS